LTVGYKPFLIVFMYPIILTKLYTMITITFTVTPVDSQYPRETHTHSHEDMDEIEGFIAMLKHANSFTVSDLVLYYNITKKEIKS